MNKIEQIVREREAKAFILHFVHFYYMYFE